MSRARDIANRTIASAALPKAGGAMTGAITTNSTFDGIDIATRDAILTSTTTIANAAATSTELELIEKNVAMLGFLRASDDAKAQYSLVDQVIDQFQDATGIDAATSSNHTHDNSSKFYGSAPGLVGPAHFEGTGSHQTFTIPTGVTSITLHIFGGQHNGLGGYTTGTLSSLTPGTVFTIVVGTVSAGSGSGVRSDWGYGGGGRGIGYVSAGGLSGIFTGSTTIALDGFASSTVQGRAILVAGGSGSRSGSGGQTPGSGGGASGTQGSGGAGPGTQVGAGAGYTSGEAGNYMEGGDSHDGNEESSGGGGYFGGGGTGSQVGGAGGSGYIGGGTLSADVSSASTYVGASSEKTSHAYYLVQNNGRVSIDYDSRVFSNMTLQSVATTAESAPTKGDIIIWIEDNAGTATVNTDIKAFISRDGSAFTGEVTLVDEGHWGSTGKRILVAHNVDLSGIASGTAMKYKITTHYQAIAKETRVHGVSLSWK